MTLTDRQFAEIMERVEREADRIAEDAGFSGATHDGGAAVLREGVAMFRLGMNRQMPAAWLPFQLAMEQERDPEYSEYLRLREKFER